MPPSSTALPDAGLGKICADEHRWVLTPGGDDRPVPVVLGGERVEDGCHVVGGDE